jgi:hypothetical protein
VQDQAHVGPSRHRRLLEYALPRHQGWLYAVALTLDRASVAAAGNSAGRVWDFHTEELLQALRCATPHRLDATAGTGHALLAFLA